MERIIYFINAVKVKISSRVSDIKWETISKIQLVN